MSQDCVFCKIASGSLFARMVHEASDWLAFEDQNPAAPVHILAIPRLHIASLANATDPGLLGRLLDGVRQIADDRGLRGGYRVVINQGSDGGQTVEHLHLHLLGGRSMTWPPG